MRGMQHRSFWEVRHVNNLLLGCNGNRARSLSEIDFGSPQIKSQDFGEEGGVDY